MSANLGVYGRKGIFRNVSKSSFPAQQPHTRQSESFHEKKAASSPEGYLQLLRAI
jgi:hypothetical protein